MTADDIYLDNAVSLDSNTKSETKKAEMFSKLRSSLTNELLNLREAQVTPPHVPDPSATLHWS